MNLWPVAVTVQWKNGTVLLLQQLSKTGVVGRDLELSALELSPLVPAAQQLPEHCATGCYNLLGQDVVLLGGKLVPQKSSAFLLFAVGKRISNLGFGLE